MRSLFLSPSTTCFPFAELVSNMVDERVLAITDPKDREFIRFSVGESFNTNDKILEAVVPRSQSAGPSDAYIVCRVRDCAPVHEAAKRDCIALHMGPTGGDCGLPGGQ